MSGRNNMKLIVASAAIAFAFFLALAVYAPQAFFGFNLAGRATLSDQTPSVVQQSAVEQHVDPNHRMKIIVSLKLRDEQVLDQLLLDLANPRSPQYRHYLTPEEFVTRFSPTTWDVNSVSAFLKEYGIVVTNVSPNRTLIEAEGTVDQLERAFKVTINQYTAKKGMNKGRTYLSNDRDPQIPRTLEPTIESVIGLNTISEFHSRLRRRDSNPTDPLRLREQPPLQQPPAQPAPVNPGTPRGNSPGDIATVYQFPNGLNTNVKGDKLTGKGMTLAITTAEVYDLKDVQAFWKEFGIVRTGTLTDVYINGQSTVVNDETTLDLESASAQIPGADIIMYMSKTPSFSNFTLMFNRVVTDNKADVMSLSWGLCEEDTGKRHMKSEHNIFKQGAAQGIAMFVASGDDGAYDCKVPEPDEDEADGSVHKHDDPPANTTKAPAKKQPPKLSVDYPSADPYFVAVGGTTLLDRNGKRLAEWAWHGSGGGVSSYWPRPSWQTGPGVPTGDKRATADVSMNADPSTGYSIFFKGKWESWGGTSISAPEWAALWILIDEAAGKRIGSPNEIFYRVGDSPDYSKVFYDITSGDNGDFQGPGYKSGANWDHPTGWGVPQGEALKDWIVQDVKQPHVARPSTPDPVDPEDEVPVRKPTEVAPPVVPIQPGEPVQSTDKKK